MRNEIGLILFLALAITGLVILYVASPSTPKGGSQSPPQEDSASQVKTTEVPKETPGRPQGPRILDGLEKTPLSGALVTVFRPQGTQRVFFLGWLVRQKKEQILWQTKSAADGSFHWPEGLAWKGCLVRITSPGYAPWIGAAKEEALRKDTFFLRPGGLLRLTGLPPGTPIMLFDPEGLVSTKKTDSAGEVSFSRLRSGSYGYLVGDPEEKVTSAVPDVSSPGIPFLSLKVREGEKAEYNLASEVAKLAHLRVSLNSQAGGLTVFLSQKEPAGLVFRSRVYQGGVISFPYLPEGTYTLSVQPRLGRPLVRTIELVSGDSRELELDFPLGSVKGRFAAVPSGKSLEAVLIRRDGSGQLSLPLGQDGSFSFTGLAPGPYVLRIVSEGQKIAEKSVTVAPGELSVSLP